MCKMIKWIYIFKIHRPSEFLNLSENRGQALLQQPDKETLNR